MKGRRQTKPATDRPSVVDTHRFSSRDSDASFCSSRPSSIGTAGAIPTDRASQASALRTINSYLSSLSNPIHLRPPLPSAKDIIQTLHLLLARLDWSTTSDPTKLEDDLPVLLTQLRCPVNLKKSALKAPSTPHAWPTILASIHWLVQIARYRDHLASNPSPFYSLTNDLALYIVESYSHFIRGDDDTAAALDCDFMQKLEQQVGAADDAVKTLEKEAEELELKLQAIRSAPSARELLEKEKADLLKDSEKFHAVIESYESKVVALEKGLEERQKELDVKVEENQRVCTENEGLRKQIDSQAVNVRDVERMKRELQAVEQDIADAEAGRNGWEEKMWELEATVGKKMKELEGLASECNQAIRRLKLGNDFQYVLNAKGTSPAEVLGIGHKSTLKPALTALADDIKKSSVVKLEEFISLQQQSRENSTKLEEKKNRLVALQTKIEEVEAQLSLLKKEMQDHMARCAAEANRLHDDVARRTHNLDIMEGEAEVFLKHCKQNLQDVIQQNDDETQMCACELLALIDAVSKYKECMESTISGMKMDLSETAGAVAEAYKASLSAKMRLECVGNQPAN
ncbi:kinetochore protein NDC80 homolog [Magnolia sinica]|uniref:kinetochore protein NDC80 homolog n=1 Tax=Magnolia sinica TaxID=86752 RepID=UPI0026598290|nr:kinetochore protein NDC80 homolog [Magnolia sinica]